MKVCYYSKKIRNYLKTENRNLKQKFHKEKGRSKMKHVLNTMTTFMVKSYLC